MAWAVQGGLTLRASAVATVEGFTIDPSFAPVPLKPSNTQRMAMLAANKDNQHVVVRATLTAAQLAAARANPNVVEVWTNAVIEPIACPIPPCDCAPGTPKGTITDAANYLGVNQIWSAGKRGEGIVVGVVDGGITATGRPLAAATPIAAGLCALLKQAKPTATHNSIKAALIATAKDIGPVGWDQHSGAGIIGGKRAHDRLVGIIKLKEFKQEKIEIKEIKLEKNELKERKLEKVEIKDKHEIIESKGLKDIRDHVVKPVAENPIPHPGPIRDPIRVGLPGQPGMAGSQLETRVAGLEAYIEALATFITPDMRPDLSRGALANEGDLQDGVQAGDQFTKEANDAMMNKMDYDNSAR